MTMDTQEAAFSRTMDHLVQRRNNKTLARWLNDLNTWRWPKAIPEPESPDVKDTPRRWIAMDACLRVLGWRMVREVEKAG
jgi:hypothetical protein